MEGSELSLSMKMVLRRVREENESLAAVVIENTVRVKNLEKNTDEEKRNGMALLQKLKLPKQEV